MIDHLGTYGTPAMVLIHNEPQVKYPTEVKAAAHIYNPDDEQFVPAPISTHLYCYACRQRKHHDSFYANSARPNGKQTRCKACYKAGKKTAALRSMPYEHWYRG